MRVAHAGGFVSPALFLFDRVLVPVGSRAEQCVIGRSVNLPHRPRVSRTFGPLRQMGLAGGDRVSAEVVRWGDDFVSLRLASGQTMTVPADAIETLIVPPGESELLAERFESDDVLGGFIDEAVRSTMTFDRKHAASGDRSLRLASPLRPLTVTCPAGLDAARVQMWFRADRTSSAAIGGRIAFEFGEPPHANALDVELSGARVAVGNRPDVTARWTTQTVELHTGWHCLTAVFLPSRVLCLVNETLLAAGPGIEVPLRSIRLTARDGLWIDDLSVSRVDENIMSCSLRLPHADDTVTTHAGEEFYGRVTQVTAQGVTLDRIAGGATMPWSRVAGVGFRPTDRPLSGPALPPEGVVACIDWTPFVDRPQLRTDRVTATLLATDRDGVIVAHPWLGEFPIPWRDLRRIEPLYIGRDLVLDARRVHLGDSIRADFRRPLPDGSEWRREFVLTARPHGDVWLSLFVADLEPSGPETPPGSAHLRELRAGRLLTEVIVNDEPVGDLNRHLRFRASSDQPERLRCRLPPDVLRAGANSLRLRQRPLTENSSDYDDSELSDLRLELRSTSTAR